MSSLSKELRTRLANLKLAGVSGGGILLEAANEIDLLTQTNINLRKALIEAHEATQDDEGTWVDRNGDPVTALNFK